MTNTSAAHTLEPWKPGLVAAMKLHVTGRREEARAAYAALLGEYPEQPDIAHALGMLHMQGGEWKEAARYLQQAANADPKNPRSLLPLSHAYLQAGEREAAMEALVQLLALDTDNTEGSQLLQELCLPEAKNAGMKESAIGRLVKAHPKNTGLRSAAAALALTLGDVAERLKHLEAIYEQGARSESFYYSYAISLNQNARFEQCLTLCREGLKKYPESMKLIKASAIAHGCLGEHEQALAQWQEVVARQPQDKRTWTPEDYASLAAIGFLKLLISDGKDGTAEYEACRDYAIIKEGLVLPLPEWRGESLKGKKLLVWTSQGIGDIVMFASLIPWLMQQGAAQITVAAPPKLIPLFLRAFPDLSIIPYSKNNLQVYAPLCDVQVVLDQLMAYGLPHYTPSDHPPYFKADSTRVRKLREKYLALKPGAKKLVGIAWHTINNDTASQRNIPLEQWAPLFSLPDVQFVSLQYGNHAADIEAVNKQFPGALYADPEVDAFEDADGLSAQIAACDEVVTIQNATAHMAGALGVKTTLLLCAASDWRWGLKRTDSRWYRSIYIERQQKLLDWRPVLMRVRERLMKEPPVAETLVAQLARDPNDTAAALRLYELCLPGLKHKDISKSAIHGLIAAHPGVVALHSVAVRLCRDADERAERLKHLEAIYRHGVQGSDFFTEYAAMLGYTGQYDRCIEVCDEAIRLYPDAAGPYRVRANMHGIRKEYEQAMACYSRILELKPGDIQARMLRGMIKLLLSDCREGFEDYAAVRDRVFYQCKFRMNMPEWQGEPLKGKKLLLWCNEGIGDALMFAGMFPWLFAQGAKTTLALYPKLVPLFARSFPNVNVIPYTPDTPKAAEQLFAAHEKTCDYQLAVSQVMRHALPRYTPAEHPPHLKADMELAGRLREKYLNIKPGIKKLVGISWFSSNEDNSSQRNIPLMDWEPLFSLPHVQVVSLQYGNHAAEIEAVNRKFPGAVYVDPDIDAFGNVDGLAAQLCALDEVVSIQNTTVHLGGALGVKTTLMLSAASDWRWGLKHTHSHWYKSVYIERQETLLDWQPVLARVRDRLKAST